MARFSRKADGLEDGYPLGPVREKFELFLFDTRRERHWRGAFGTGKTTALVRRHGLRRIKYPGSVGLLARAQQTAFNRTTLVNFLNEWSSYGTYAKTDGAFYWDNGSVTWFVGLDSPIAENQLKSLEVLDADVDEANEITEDIYKVLHGRCRWQPKGKLRREYLEKGLATVSDDARYHATPVDLRPLVLPYTTASISNYNGKDWIYYRFFDAGISPENKATRLAVEASTFENHSLPPNYAEDLIRDNGMEWAKRFIYGSHDLPYGRILWAFGEHNLFDPLPIPRHWPAYVWLDVGYQHPTAALVVRVSDDGRWWVVADYLESEQTARDNARAISALVGDARLLGVYGSPDAARIDPTSGKSTADEYRLEGLSIIPATIKHDDSVLLVNKHLRAYATRPGQDALPRLMVSSACIRTIKQVEQMTWELRAKKIGDDLYDAIRMGAAMMPEGVRASHAPAPVWALPPEERDAELDEDDRRGVWTPRRGGKYGGY